MTMISSLPPELQTVMSIVSICRTQIMETGLTWWHVDRWLQCLCVQQFAVRLESVKEATRLIKEVLLLQYHVAPLQYCPIRDIYQAGSSLPEVLCSCTTVSGSCKDIDLLPSHHLHEAHLCDSWRILERSFWLFDFYLCVHLERLRRSDKFYNLSKFKPNIKDHRNVLCWDSLTFLDLRTSYTTKNSIHFI